jgi:hypothetical protein
MPWIVRFGVGLVIGLAALFAWRTLSTGSAGLLREFAQQVDAASLRRPSADVFSTEDVVIEGVSRRSITVNQSSRIAWDFTMPEGARLTTYVALREDTWNRPGDGVLFRIGVSFEGKYEELLTRVVQPKENVKDRGWIPVELDLTPYVGKQVSLVFNTGSGLEGDNRENDHAVWGAPALFGRGQ